MVQQLRPAFKAIDEQPPWYHREEDTSRLDAARAVASCSLVLSRRIINIFLGESPPPLTYACVSGLSLMERSGDLLKY
jgi:hypothetical protein